MDMDDERFQQMEKRLNEQAEATQAMNETLNKFIAIMGVEDGRVNMVRYTGVFAVELHYLWLCMYLCMHLPLIVTLVITLELDQVLQSVVTHVAVQDNLDLILFLTVDESWGWGWCRSSARDRIRRHWRQLDHRGDGVKAAEVGGQSEVVCAMANTGFNDKGA
jgi:hypothetical protein